MNTCRRSQEITAMTAPPGDPYVILGVATEASDDDLDHAFRELVRRLHPDTRAAAAPDDADWRLQEVLNAYAILRDPIRRAAYDRAARAAHEHPAAPHIRVRRTTAGTAPAPRRTEPAIRVGPVRWQPPRS
jgi:curved DNA-binding protein CbpA